MEERLRIYELQNGGDETNAVPLSRLLLLLPLRPLSTSQATCGLRFSLTIVESVDRNSVFAHIITKKAELQQPTMFEAQHGIFLSSLNFRYCIRKTIDRFKLSSLEL